MMASEVEKDSKDVPRRIRTRDNRYSKIRLGRTIGASRDRLETASERNEARRRVKKQQTFRFVFTLVAFALVAIIIGLIINMVSGRDSTYTPTISVPYAPTIEVIDEDAGTTAKLSSAMKEYIGQAEADFRELGYTPAKVVRPIGSIREIDFYLEGIPGYIKLTTDRGTGVSVEDADRMIRYLKDQGITEYSYIDVRIERKAYYK